jgi:hypothetical protein
MPVSTWDADRYQRQFGFVSTFGPAARRERVVARTGELAAPRLWRDGRFVADYWRLRFLAVATDDAARPAKLHRQMAGNGDR